MTNIPKSQTEHKLTTTPDKFIQSIFSTYAQGQGQRVDPPPFKSKKKYSACLEPSNANV